MSVATRRVQSRNSPSPSFMMLALWIAVTRLRPCLRACSKANRAMLVDALSVMIFQRFDHAGHDLVFEAGVEVFSVLAHDHEVDLRIPAVDAGQVAHRPQVREQIQCLAQPALTLVKPQADGSGHRALQRDRVPLDRVEEQRRQRLARLLEGDDARIVPLHSMSSAAALKMRTTDSVTSGPMPSPGISVMVWLSLPANRGASSAATRSRSCRSSPPKAA